MPTRGEFRIEVTKDYLVFAAAHFITFEGARCEPLHGHNYRVGVVIEGMPDEESWYVFDFVRLKQLMRELCNEIDHKVLLPLQNPRITVATERESVTVALDGRPRYVFPREDCVLLPLPNTTVEMLARHLTQRIRGQLDAGHAGRLTAIQLEVEENFGQSAVYRERLDPQRQE